MNATHPVSRTPSTPASVNSSKPGGPAPDFAAALTGAAAKPARKAGGHKTAGTGVIGGHLPADGNVSPPAPAPPTATSAGASAASFAAGTVGNTATAGLAVESGTGAISSGAAKIPHQASDSTAPGPVAAAPGAVAAAPGAVAAADSPDAGPTGAAAMKFGAGFAPAFGLPLDPGADGTTLWSISGNPSPAAATAAAPGTPAAPLAGSLAAMATPRHTMDTAAATAATAALKAATSGSSSNAGASGPATNAGAATADGTAAPAADAMSASAAAMSAAATGLVVSNGDDFAGAADAPSFTADAMVSPGARAVAGTQAPNGAPALAATRAAAATAAHANAQAASALADADASDKHAAGGADPAPLTGIPGDAGAGAAQSVNPSSVTDSAPAPTLRVPAGVDTPEFGQGIADRVSWMVDNNLNGAKLQVNPPQLGPIEVRISVQGGHAQVWFTSHSAVARDALESSSPKLREMLGAQGFGQVSVDISQGSFHERPAYSQPYDWTPSANRGPTTLAVQSTAVSPRASSGALDAYA